MFSSDGCSKAYDTPAVLLRNILAQLSGSSELRYKMSSVSRQQEQYLDLRNIAAGNRTCSIFKQQAAGNSRCDWLTREAGE